MPKRQGPESFAKRQRERAKQMKNMEKQQRRRDKKSRPASGQAPAGEDYPSSADLPPMSP